nr:MAG TPA_asm: hypothetical protein [Caudoviricetes sp.]
MGFCMGFSELGKSPQNTNGLKNCKHKAKTAQIKRFKRLMLELLGRFELPTSSLPIIYALFSLVVSCRILLPRSPYISGNAGFFMSLLIVACCILK